MSFYANSIVVAPDADPARVEAWMRREHGTLDALSAEQFTREVHTALSCITLAGLAESDALARARRTPRRIRDARPRPPR